MDPADLALRPVAAPARRTTLTSGLLLLMTAVLVMEVFLPPSLGVDRPTRVLGLSRVHVLDGEWWRLVTASLVNPATGGSLKAGAVVHWLINALAIWKLGPALERRCLGAEWVAVALVSAVFAEGWLIICFPHSSGYGGGTSVVAVGFAGALVSLAWRRRRESAGHWKRCARSLAIAVALSLLAGAAGMDPAVNQAHLAALVTGLVLGVRLRATSQRTEAARRVSPPAEGRAC